MNPLDIKVVVLGSVRQVTLAAGSNVADACQEAGVSADLEVRFRGTRLDEAAQRSTLLEDGDVIIATPPAVKHG